MISKDGENTKLNYGLISCGFSNEVSKLNSYREVW